jgi:hypothetical protein
MALISGHETFSPGRSEILLEQSIPDQEVNAKINSRKQVP